MGCDWVFIKQNVLKKALCVNDKIISHILAMPCVPDV
jgi:hypothetical protein